MYSIVLTDGKIVNIRANDVIWDKGNGMAGFFDGSRLVSRINMDNVVGWIQTDYKVESEGK